MSDAELFTPHIPEVDIRPEIGTIFDRARAAASELHINSDGIQHHQVIIVTPGRLLIGKECPLAKDIPVEQLALLGELVPPQPRVNIVVIAYTHIDALKADIRRAIPFFDFLLGFAALGHSIWVFEGHSSALEAGCREADLLLVDSRIRIFLDAQNLDWQKQALTSMRGDVIKFIAQPNADR